MVEMRFCEKRDGRISQLNICTAMFPGSRPSACILVSSAVEKSLVFWGAKNGGSCPAKNGSQDSNTGSHRCNTPHRLSINGNRR